MANTQGKIESLGTMESKTKLDQIWFNISPPTAFYTGRNKEMQEIEEQWKKCEESKTMMFVAVTGLGGIGKSEIAKNYAKTFYEKVKGHCIGIDSETNQTLLQSFQDLARHLKISIQDESGKEKSLNNLTMEIYEKISDQKCLIIFDNMESFENSALSQLIDSSLKSPSTVLKPMILMTSRIRPAITNWIDNCFHLELEVLSTESAIAFFYQSFNLNSIPDAKSDLIPQLCKRLGNYPLAMQQAVAYINECLSDKSTDNLEKEIQNYLQQIEVNSQAILDHQLPKDGTDGAQNTTFFTWTLTMNKIEELADIGTRAVKMMSIISFMASDNISTDFLLKILSDIEGHQKSDDEKSPKSECNTRCLEILRDHSMISLSEKKLSIHRLVQEVTRIQLIEKGKFTDCLNTLMTCVQKMLKDYKIPGDQMIHTEMIWEYTCTNEELIRKHEQFPNWICWNLDYLGKYRELYNFSCQAVSTLDEFFEENHRSILKLKCWKGSSLQELGEYAEALELLTPVQEKQKEFFGEEDDHYLQTSKEIGLVHWRLKQVEKALKYYRPALEIRERVFGEEHQGTLTLKNNIALALDDQGKYSAALELLQQVLEMNERVKGKEHQETLTTKTNLGKVKFHQGQYEEALKIFLEVMTVEEIVAEVDHPLPLITKEWIAYTYGFLGRKEEALHLWEEVWQKRVKVLGPQHPRTILAQNSVEYLNSMNQPMIIELR